MGTGDRIGRRRIKNADTAHAPGMIGTVAFTPQTADKVSNVLGRGILGKPAGRPQQ